MPELVLASTISGGLMSSSFGAAVIYREPEVLKTEGICHSSRDYKARVRISV